MQRLQLLMRELRRRHVFRVAGVYVVAAWVAVQVADTAFPGMAVPDAAIRYVWLAAFLGFPLALVIGWRYDITTQGIVRTPPADAETRIDLSLRRTDHVILALLMVVAAGVIYQLTIQISDSRFIELAEIIQQDIEPNSIAVLPLENLSGNPEQAYFVSGMQDALIAGLSRISALRVTSKTSTIQFRDTDESLPRIAATLGVSNLIEGSVYRVDDRLRITLKLVDARLDEQIWSKTFESEIKDVLLLQSEVAQAIAEQVEVTVTPNERAQLTSAEKVNPAAYEAYLKGQFHVERFTPQDMMLAAQYYQQALKLDPESALAQVGLSKLCTFQSQAGLITPKEGREQCLPPIKKALALDDSLPEAHLMYALHMAWLRFDWEEGGAGFLRAIELSPSYSEARIFYSHFLSIVGCVEEGTAQMQLALELDPLNPFIRVLSAVQLFMTGDIQGAVSVTENVMASTPGFGFGFDMTWPAYHLLGERDKAIAAAVNHFRVTSGDPTSAMALEQAHAEGDYEGAYLHLAKLLAVRSKSEYIEPTTIAMLFEFAGKEEKAIDWYEIAFREYDTDAPYLGVMSQWSTLRSNPGFIKLLSDAKLDYWADKYSQSKN